MSLISLVLKGAAAVFAPGLLPLNAILQFAIGDKTGASAGVSLISAGLLDPVIDLEGIECEFEGHCSRDHYLECLLEGTLGEVLDGGLEKFIDQTRVPTIHTGGTDVVLGGVDGSRLKMRRALSIGSRIDDLNLRRDSGSGLYVPTGHEEPIGTLTGRTIEGIGDWIPDKRLFDYANL